MKSQWIIHNGKKIWYSDCSGLGLDTDAIRAEMEYAVSMVQKEPENSVLSLTNITNIRATPTTFAIMKDAAKGFQAHVEKRAVVGITGTQKTFINLLNKMSGTKSYQLFDDVASAKAWLAEN